MKRLFFVLLAFCLCIVVPSCGRADDGGVVEKDSSSSADTTASYLTSDTYEDLSEEVTSDTEKPENFPLIDFQPDPNDESILDVHFDPYLPRIDKLVTRSDVILKVTHTGTEEKINSEYKVFGRDYCYYVDFYYYVDSYSVAEVIAGEYEKDTVSLSRNADSTYSGLVRDKELKPTKSQKDVLREGQEYFIFLSKVDDGEYKYYAVYVLPTASPKSGLIHFSGHVKAEVIAEGEAVEALENEQSFVEYIKKLRNS